MFILYSIMIILMIYLIGDTQDGRTALHSAVSRDYYDCAQLLIQSGADVDIKSNVSHFMFILYIIMIILMIYLIDDTQNGWTALHWAVWKGHYDCAQLLIVSAADTNIRKNV